MPLVTVASGAKVWVEEKGEGKPILFVHGWPLSGIPWQSQLDGLSAEHHVLTIDLPGFGRSPPLEETVTIKGLATAVRDMLDARDLTDVFMIGWSMGGGVIFSYFEHFGSHRLRAAGVVDNVAMLLPATTGCTALTPRGAWPTSTTGGPEFTPTSRASPAT